MEELEIKYLDIDKGKLEKKLNELGATKVADYHYRRIVFDYPDFRIVITPNSHSTSRSNAYRTSFRQ